MLGLQRPMYFGGGAKPRAWIITMTGPVPPLLYGVCMHDFEQTLSVNQWMNTWNIWFWCKWQAGKHLIFSVRLCVQKKDKKRLTSRHFQFITFLCFSFILCCESRLQKKVSRRTQNQAMNACLGILARGKHCTLVWANVSFVTITKLHYNAIRAWARALAIHPNYTQYYQSNANYLQQQHCNQRNQQCNHRNQQHYVDDVTAASAVTAVTARSQKFKASACSGSESSGTLH